MFPRFHTVVFVDGCFWHSCPQHGVMPKKRRSFWKKKLATNIERDRRVTTTLRRSGWQVVRVWEHQVNADAEKLANRVAQRIKRQRI